MEENRAQEWTHNTQGQLIFNKGTKVIQWKIMCCNNWNINMLK